MPGDQLARDLCTKWQKKNRPQKHGLKYYVYWKTCKNKGKINVSCTAAEWQEITGNVRCFFPATPPKTLQPPMFWGGVAEGKPLARKNLKYYGYRKTCKTKEPQCFVHSRRMARNNRKKVPCFSLPSPPKTIQTPCFLGGGRRQPPGKKKNNLKYYGYWETCKTKEPPMFRARPPNGKKKQAYGTLQNIAIFKHPWQEKYQP